MWRALNSTLQKQESKFGFLMRDQVDVKSLGTESFLHNFGSSAWYSWGTIVKAVSNIPLK